MVIVILIVLVIHLSLFKIFFLYVSEADMTIIVQYLCWMTCHSESVPPGNV